MIVDRRVALPKELVPPEVKPVQAKELSAPDLCGLAFHEPKPKCFAFRLMFFCGIFS